MKGIYFAVSLFGGILHMEMCGQLFRYNIYLMTGAIIACLCLISGSGRIQDREYRNKLGDQLDKNNPLYAKGYFRKNASPHSFFSNLKGNFYCEMGLLAVIFIAVTYRIFWISEDMFRYGESHFLTDLILTVCFWGLDMAWLGFHMFYIWSFREAFRYPQNSEGIWEPFRNITRDSRHINIKYYTYNYDFSYGILQKKIRENCIKRKYQNMEYYKLSQEDEDGFIAMKKNGKDVVFFQITHMKLFSEKAMQELNVIFENYWKKHIKNMQDKTYTIIFLVCIDEYNKDLRKAKLLESEVEQKQGYYRIPSFLVYSEKPNLYIPGCYHSYKNNEKYQEMKRELLSLLEIGAAKF